jgi:hypothetical protein
LQTDVWDRHKRDLKRVNEEEDTCMSYEEDTCMSCEEEDTCMPYEGEDKCMPYEKRVKEASCFTHELN